ncbi:RNA polymerase sigma factor [Streptomyces sp. NPDC047000]|uniref:RNA polymerase sigma factor n=1 Tax=Streptomyces sp. NPDC047000 TaxID=3155474 RepID=UPI0033EC60E7
MSSQANAKITPRGGRTAALVAAAAAGDRDAFASLYNEHRPTVYRYLCRRTQSAMVAEDLTSDTFVRALRTISAFADRPGSGGFSAWLTVIAHNLLVDHYKAASTKREVPVGEFFDADQLLLNDAADVDVLRHAEAVETVKSIRGAMAGLTEYQRECIRLRFFRELSLPETAARLNTTQGAVKTLTHRALRSMQRTLTEDGAAA